MESPYIYPHRGSVIYPTALNGRLFPTYLTGWRGPVQFRTLDGKWLEGVLVEHGTWPRGNYLIERTGRQEPLARQAHQIRLDLTQPEALLWTLYWMQRGVPCPACAPDPVPGGCSQCKSGGTFPGASPGWLRRPMLNSPFSRLDLLGGCPPDHRRHLLAQIIAWEALWYAEHGVFAFKGVYNPWEPLYMNPQTEAERNLWTRPPQRIQGTPQPSLTATHPDLRAQADETALQFGYVLLDRKEEGQPVYSLTLPPAATLRLDTEEA